MKIISKFCYIFLLFPAFLMGFEDKKFDYIKEKNISKTYNVNANATTEISNSYGNINVYLWDENKISIQVFIKVSGNNESRVNDKLNDITIDFSASDMEVDAKTVLGTKSWSKGNMSYEINYTIKIPRNGAIDLNNKYGNISVDKLNGSSSISIQYGSLLLGQFYNKNNDFNIAYSKNSSIESIDKLNLSCQYSDLVIQKVNQINIEGNYNDFNINAIGALNLVGNYTKIKSSSIQKVIINGNYLTLKLGEISSNLKLNSNYTDLQFLATSRTDKIDIDGNYTNVKISCQPTYNFNFDINLRYGSLKENLDLKFTEKSEKSSSKSYLGYNGNQNKSKLNVSLNYGTVQLLNN